MCHRICSIYDILFILFHWEESTLLFLVGVASQSWTRWRSPPFILHINVLFKTGCNSISQSCNFLLAHQSLTVLALHQSRVHFHHFFFSSVLLSLFCCVMLSFSIQCLHRTAESLYPWDCSCTLGALLLCLHTGEQGVVGAIPRCNRFAMWLLSTGTSAGSWVTPDSLKA